MDRRRPEFMNIIRLMVFGLALVGVPWSGEARTYRVESTKEISEVLPELEPGDTLRLRAGEYAGNLFVDGLNGREEAPIIIEGEGPGGPPVFKGGKEGIHLKDCNHVGLRNLKVVGAVENGINIDDGGTKDTPSTNILLDRVVVEDTGPKGNRDAIKMSGVQQFLIKNCRVSGWASSGVDFVGCHQGVVTGCRFIGKEGFGQKNGIQIKGGSHTIIVEKSFFKNAGERAVNLGGSTGLQYFRPEVEDFEARDVEVGGNIFVYGGAAVAFVTSQRGFVRNNAILYPSGYVLRILQESTDPRFRPCGRGLFMRNIVVVDERMRRFVNIGPGTDPKSFTFQENLWYDESGHRKPDPPSGEIGPVYGLNPEPAVKEGRIRFLSRDPRLKGKGPGYYRSRVTD